MSVRENLSEFADRQLLREIDRALSGVDAAPAQTERDPTRELCVRLAAARPVADPAFRKRLEHQVVAAHRHRLEHSDDTSEVAWWRRLSRLFEGRRFAAAAASATLALVVVCGVALWTTPVVWAQIQRLACFVPGLGIRNCDAPGLVMAQPAEVVRGRARLRLETLLSSGGTTTVRGEVRGLEMTPSLENADLTRQARLVLRDPHGREYLPLRRMISGGPAQYLNGQPLGGAGQVLFIDGTFPPLDPNTRAVDLVIDGPEPIGHWSVQVPIVTVQEAGLVPARDGTVSATGQGITVQLGAVAAGPEQIAVQLVGSAAPPRWVIEIAGQGGNLVLRDDRGREYYESLNRTPPARPVRQDGSVRSEAIQIDAVFPAVQAGAHPVEVIVPFVTVGEDTEPVALSVPTRGRAVGEQIPLEAGLQLGRHRFRVTTAAVVRERGAPWLRLNLDLGDWRGGQKLVAVSAQVAGQQVREFVLEREPTEVGQLRAVVVPLPVPEVGETTIVFRRAEVAVQGPWRLAVAGR